MVLDRYKHIYIAIAMKEIRYVFSKNGATKLRSTAYVDWKMSSTYTKPKMTVRFSVHRHNTTIYSSTENTCVFELSSSSRKSQEIYCACFARCKSLQTRAQPWPMHIWFSEWTHAHFAGQILSHAQNVPCSILPVRAGWPRASERKPKANWR